MRWIGQNGQNYVLSVECPFCSVSQMIFHITCTVCVLTLGFLLKKLLEYRLSWLLKDAMQSVQPSPMSHSELNILYTWLSGCLCQLLQCTCSRVDTFDAESLVVTELDSQEVNKCLVFSQSLQSCHLLFLCRLLSLKQFDLCLQLGLNEVTLFFVEKMHVLKSNLVTVNAIQQLLEFFDSVRTVVRSIFTSQILYDYFLS